MGLADYIVCPRCGSPMRFVNGKWFCPVCKNIILDKDREIEVENGNYLYSPGIKIKRVTLSADSNKNRSN